MIAAAAPMKHAKPATMIHSGLLLAVFVPVVSALTGWVSGRFDFMTLYLQWRPIRA